MAVIIGAGPSGLLLAHFLLSYSSRNELVRGLLPIRILENRDDPRTPLPLYKARQYVVGLSARGRDSISKINGLWEEAEKIGVPSSQFVLHIGGREIALKRDPSKPSLLVNQRSLAAVLAQELENRYGPEQVQITYGARCTDVDFDSQTVTIHKESEKKTLLYDLLVGADGARSVVRGGFIGERGFDYQQINVPYTFKVLQIPRPVEISDGTAVHSFRVTDKETGKSFSFGCFPTPNHGTSVLISWSPQTIPAELLQIHSPAELKAYVEKFMPPLKVPLEAAEAFISQRPTSSMQVRCNRFFSEKGRAVLIGDAAHAMSNALGQGCNSSLKDVEVLSYMLLQEKSDLIEALRQYSEQQVKEDHAAAYLSQHAFPESKWLRPAYLLGNIVSAGLGRTPLKVILPPSIQNLCSETLTPYTEIVNKNRSWLKLVEVTNLLK